VAPFDAGHSPARRFRGVVVIRVVVTGSECTGKTTLAEALATHYEAAWVPEFARTFVDQKGATPDYEDVDAIARGQVALEDQYSAAAPDILVQDTDLLSTLVYSNHYYGECPDWIEEALRDRAADLYLLAGIDLPWVADGDQRDRGDRRDEMHELFRSALADRGLPFIEIHGSHDERLAAALSAIDALERA
jgi:NadR type nicotinamide-nucleotide adenylyltransferase